jgi:hypothetical protein
MKLPQKPFIVNKLLDDPRRRVFTHVAAQKNALVALDSRLDKTIPIENNSSHMCCFIGVETMNVKPNLLDVHL